MAIKVVNTFSLYSKESKTIEGSYLSFKANVDEQTNNRAELLSLLALLKFAYNRNIGLSTVPSDSSIVIQWMKNEALIQNINLIAVALQTLAISKMFF